ncbi:hypothetical protein ACFQJD_06145 [Haloplanus sp. GCM10025708]|uniref:DUF7504 family protein n=1 Tax=Haloferacaceae TaxID=1644056 RepID=UPI00361E5B37
MTGGNSGGADRAPLQVDSFPTDVDAGSTVLVASAGDPTRYAVGLRLLCEYGTGDDAALVVTTTEGVGETLDAYDALCSESNRPTLRVVDTASEQQSVSALHGETPVVFTPSPDDLERLVLALSDVAENALVAGGDRHLVVRSLTPALNAASLAHVRTVLERITEFRSGAGLCLLWVDYTAHDEGAMEAVAELVDGVLWVTRSGSRIEFDYRSTRGRYDPLSDGGDD